MLLLSRECQVERPPIDPDIAWQRSFGPGQLRRKHRQIQLVDEDLGLGSCCTICSVSMYHRLYMLWAMHEIWHNVARCKAGPAVDATVTIAVGAQHWLGSTRDIDHHSRWWAAGALRLECGILSLNVSPEPVVFCCSSFCCWAP